MTGSQQNEFKLPSIALPKGGGAIQGIGEKFQFNSVTGTASFSLPVPLPTIQRGLSPSILLNYNSGSGNGIFGLGWQISIPFITRKTSKGIPKYDDAAESDTFLYSDAEDLVPYLEQNEDNWNQAESTDGNYKIKRYIPRTEGAFSKIEKFTHITTGESYWTTVSKENITHVFGRSSTCRITDPDDSSKIFQWCIEESYDTKGNYVSYEYKQENGDEIENSIFEKNRIGNSNTFVNKYPKKIHYGNKTSGDKSEYHFQIVFDYGEHDESNPSTEELTLWSVRKDPFSTFKPGFELRTYRLCNRILIFHSFNELGTDPYLTKCVAMNYKELETSTLLTSVTYTGYKNDSSGTLVSKSLPPVEFSYTGSEISTAVNSVDSTSLDEFSNGASIEKYQWIDLYGEGINGLLTEQSNAWFYKSNLGEATFAPATLVAEKPSLSTFEQNQPFFTDIDGDGNYELVLRENHISGYFKQSNGEWEDFRNISNPTNIDWNNPNLRFVDLNGDGIADILITEDDVIRYYLSKGTDGFEESSYTRKMQDEEKNPVLLFSNKKEAILLADMNADGLIDIVRIRNGEICYWPNSGYGRFADKVTMDGSPTFDNPERFDPARIRLGDIDGSGTTDILYIGHQTVSYWTNESGNSWAEKEEISTLPFTDNTTSVFLQDLLGSGTSCLVWSSPDNVTGGMKFHYIDLMSSQKPNLLSTINNNLGKEINIQYASSTKFYLEDKKNGTPWITRLPFPVHVIESVRTTDHISSSSLSTSYKYHHGYYDSEEQEFRGFGMLEQTDTESFDTYDSENQLDMSPVYTKTWVHTGAYTQHETISLQYSGGYFQDDELAHNLADSTIENDSSMDYRSMREACRSLRGKVLRQEIYSNDGSDKESIPYKVTENNYKVVQLQPPQDERHGVYLVSNRETIEHYYERDVTDPRIAHSFVLETDEYGNVLKSVNVVYPRRSNATNVYTEQQEMHITAQTHEYINNTTDFYRIGIPLETKSFEINGLSVSTDSCFLFDEIESSLETVFNEENILKHNESFTGSVQARLTGWTRNYYCDESSLLLETGSVTENALLHHSEQIVMSTEWVNDVYGDKVTYSMLSSAGYTNKEGYWWRSGSIISYKNDSGFYLPCKTIDPFGNESNIEFDDYNLLPITQTDALENTISAEIDYRTLGYSKVTDINGNFSEAITDAFGMVIATSVYGTVDGQAKGDDSLSEYEEQEASSLEDIIADPEKYLQGATSFTWYNLEAWTNSNEPPSFISIVRETHVSELDENESSDIQISIGYSDGFGRELQSKIKIEDGSLTDESTEIVERWLVSGRKVYNNKQKPVKQYEPFYSDTYKYQSEEEVAPVGVTPIIYYDPLGRIIRTETPKGFYSKVEFNPWKVSSYDENDTIKDSVYYVANSHLIGTGDENGEALAKAAKHYDTPTETILDSLGREFIKIQYKEFGGDELITLTEFNIQGNIVSITDPRQYEANQSRSEDEQINNFQYKYDLLRNKLYTNSKDAGDSWVLINSLGKPIHTWNGRGYHSETTYDELLRPLETRVDGNELNNVVQVFEYGENETDAKSKNLRGQLARQYDQAGLLENTLFDISGKPISSTRTLRSDYKSEANWDEPDSVTMETESFPVTTTYDALGRIAQIQKPDGSTVRNSYNKAGLIYSVDVQLKNETDFRSFVISIEYNAKGQRTKINYGNNTETIYSYEPETFRLVGLDTIRNKENGSATTLQDISYVYDPVGNIVKITDNSFETVFTANQEVEPVCEYTYDALYQLTEASGREHLALTKTDYQLPSEQYKSSHFASINDATQLRNYNEYYTFDNSGNLTQIRHVGENSYTREITVADNSNRAITDEMDTTAGIDRYFDAAGNLTSLEHIEGINWNYRNNISSVTIIERDNESDSEYYVYESAGNRLRKVKETYDASGTLLRKEEKIYIGGIEIKRIKQGTDETLVDERWSNHIMDGSSRLAIIYYWTTSSSSSTPEDENIIRYQFNNHLGSSSLETDEDGSLVSYEEYLPYGGTAFTTGESSSEVSTKEYRYTGKERDDTTGLYYYGARYYAPWSGRWLSTDPIGAEGGVNLFMFSNNNPIRFVDTTGLHPVSYIDESGEVEVDEEIIVEEKKPTTFNRIMGGLGVLGGGLEILGGVLLLLAPEPTMVTKAAGIVLILHGLDTLVAGGRSVASGLEHDTLTKTGIKGSAMFFGASEGTAETIGTVGDIVVGLVDLPAGVAKALPKFIREGAEHSDEGLKLTRVADDFVDETGEMGFEIVDEGAETAVDAGKVTASSATTASRTMSQSANALLHTTSKSSFRKRILSTIKSTPDHPLSFLLDSGGKFVKKPEKGGTMQWMQNNPKYWEAGHPVSDKINGEMLSVQIGYNNQLLGHTVEASGTGGYKMTSVVEIGGVPVDYSSALEWERLGLLTIPGGVESLPKLVVDIVSL